MRETRSRLLVRAFDYRQRRHARGVWYRLRRLLTLAREAYALPRAAAEQLEAEGYRPEAVGRELEPQRLIMQVPVERLSRIASAKRLDVRLSAELLSAEALGLVPFEPGESQPTRQEPGGPAQA